MDFSPKKLIQLIEQNGYHSERVTGSHPFYFHKELKKTGVVPVDGNKNIPKGSFMSILKQAGISKEERRNLEQQ